jgi:hypothetical protein
VKRSEIAVGQTYFRGKVVRQVIDEGPHLAEAFGAHQLADSDCVQYAVLHGDWRARARRPICTRRAFAQWAEGEVGPDGTYRVAAS